MNNEESLVMVSLFFLSVEVNLLYDKYTIAYLNLHLKENEN